ncbi:hypothetical protein SERLADRAFT_479455 [Serpula lacrymans var. lacrymans S7.9]|uniref:Uncharacterized protein n=1 Tax=Serpula lacrymans var. lacrymans (strain S7.9) TaxID=578457 RepID=F8PBS9_SERL9|nr:uncharacterized protein SERLADRAFT_479455 [Serpula lacrymans var. lacrymans S7.9]EGO19717.1 hypothetical protein SERLADRAFT_479455 [Serpula lacrymans var. lacrymans S7.9]
MPLLAAFTPLKVPFTPPLNGPAETDAEPIGVGAVGMDVFVPSANPNSSISSDVVSCVGSARPGVESPGFGFKEGSTCLRRGGMVIVRRGSLACSSKGTGCVLELLQGSHGGLAAECRVDEVPIGESVLA